MRSLGCLLLIPAVVSVVVVPGCRIFSSALPCGDDAVCAADERCVEGFCAVVNVDAEGEGDEGEGDEGEGDGSNEGEGDVVAEGEGEGEVIVGEGEGEAVVGEGEGEVVVVGEGEGEVVAGEGEGEVVDPCAPFVDDHFDGVNSEFTLAINEAPTTAQLTGGQATITWGASATPGTSMATGGGRNWLGSVVEVEMTLPALGPNDIGGFAFTNPNDLSISFDNAGNRMSLYAILVPQGVLASDDKQFNGGTVKVQVRFDGAHPVASVAGVGSFTLPTLESAQVQNAQMRIYGGCVGPCSGGSVVIHHVVAFPPGCRP